MHELYLTKKYKCRDCKKEFLRGTNYREIISHRLDHARDKFEKKIMEGRAYEA